MDKKIFADEAILKQRKEMVEEIAIESDDGVYLKGELVSFERVEMIEGYSIILPNLFQILSEEHAMIKYPSSHRPDVIFTTFDETVNIGFTVFPGGSKITDVYQTTHQVMESLEEAKDAGVILVGTCSMLEDLEGCWFAYRTNAIDGAIYNMLLTLVVEGMVLQSSFNCLLRDAGEWNPVVLEIWRTIERIK